VQKTTEAEIFHLTLLHARTASMSDYTQSRRAGSMTTENMYILD